MAKSDEVDRAEYYAEVQCERDICEWRVRRNAYDESPPETVAHGKGVDRGQVARVAKEARDRVRFERGWVRIYDHVEF
jgi:hypothetical protein